jgi:hypothetical protein
MSGNDSIADYIPLFLTMFVELEKRCDKSPQNLSELCNSQSDTLELCEKINDIACMIGEAELSTSQAFSFTKQPEFRRKWQEYLSRYAHDVFGICISRADSGRFVSAPLGMMGRDMNWRHANAAAHRIAFSLDVLATAIGRHPKETRAILESTFPLETLSSDDATESWNDYDLKESWNTLTDSAGLNTVMSLRRRSLVPYLLLPEQWKNESTGKTILLRNLEDAQRSFVFGATLAAVVLMRSIMEATLRDCYHAAGADLEQKIENTKHSLPEPGHSIALQRLRKLANKIVHLNSDRRRYSYSADDKWIERMSTILYEDNKSVEPEDEQWIETEIVYLLGVLRSLIERAP